MKNWRTYLKADPVPALLASDNAAIGYFARRDLLDEGEQPVETLWQVPEVEGILKRQLDNGACWLVAEIRPALRVLKVIRAC